MFTGIITDVGRVRTVNKMGDWRFVIETTFDTATLDLGASVCCAGVCLTVVETGVDWFAVNVSTETRSMTTLETWETGTRINLERSLKMGDEMGGHMVSGHVDGVATLDFSTSEGGSQRMSFRLPDVLARFVATKGSITINGVSLTVNDVDQQRFHVNIIPHTQNVTTLGDLAPGDRVNLEIDMLARYVARLTETDKSVD